MPIACNTTSLTGQDGSIYFTPAGTNTCLQDFSDFDSTTGDITVPATSDYKLGDPVVFKTEGSGTLDTAFTAGTTYYVISNVAGKVRLAATASGTVIVPNGDGGAAGSGIASVAVATAGAGYANGTYTGVSLKQGANISAKATVTVTGGIPVVTTVTTPGSGYTTGAGAISLTGGSGTGGVAIDASTPTTVFAGTATLTARQDTPGDKNHVRLKYAEFAAVCSVRSFEISLEREEIDITTLPCGLGNKGGKYANFRATQAGYASGSGSMEVLFTSDQTSLANRLLANSMLRSQSGASVKLYVETIAGSGANAGKPDDTASLYIEAPISIAGMSLSVTPDDVTTATVNFNLAGQPTHLLGIDLT